MIVVVENKSLKNVSESVDTALSKYGSFAEFLIQEADDEPAPRRNMKVIDIKNRTRTDYSAGSDDLNMPDEEPPAEEPPMEEPAPEPAPEAPPAEEEPPYDPGNDEDFSAGSDDLGGGDEPPAPDQGGEAPPAEGGGDATIEPDDDGGEGGEGDPGNEEDFSAGSDDLAAGGDEGGEEAPSDDGGGDQGGDQGGGGNTDLDLDQGRKLVLFQDYKNLYNNIDDFIEKLDQLPRTDPSENTIFKKCSKYLRKLKDMIYDWMILRFQTKSYFQSQYFFQQAVVSCQLVINTINKLAIIKAKKGK